MRRPDPTALLVARIGAPHGIRGEVRVKSFTAEPEGLASYGPLRTQDGRAFQVERWRPAKEVLIVKFKGVGDRNAAEALNGTELYIDRVSLPEPDDADEFYHADLIGLAVRTEAGEELGAVVAVHDFGAGDILEVAPARGPVLMLPFTREAIPTIDLEAGYLVAVPPPDAEDDENTSPQEDQPA